ncbi:MAG: hypothetical protein DRJ09_05875 [Bacteroidetes bacterium]|nr:MAG: hypothetical protein DRJ09_05875 [Bacteroidota bacterium]
MKKIIIITILFLAFFAGSLFSQDVTTVEAKDSDISDNLDLEAVASVFGEAKDLEDFEKKLNDPDLKLTNLDLNEDGEVDYLRVVETSDKEVHVVTIQAVIGKDQYQDVATIDVVKDDKGETQVQVVGDVYMYGPNYIVQPVYVHPPVIFVFFWGPRYHPWHSPFYWGYYPPYYRPWRPYPPYTYRRNVNVHVNVNNTYRTTNVRINKNSVNLQKKMSRNDFAKSHPDRSFQKRNNGVSNKQSLDKNRVNNREGSKANSGSKNATKTNNVKAKPAKKSDNKSATKVSNNKTQTKAAKPATKSSNSVKHTSKPTTKKHVSTPAHKPAARPAKQSVKKGGRR